MKVEKRWIPYLLVLPTFVYLVGMVIFPMLYATYISFFQQSPTGEWVLVGFANYKKVLSSPDFEAALANTIMFTVADVGICVGLGIGLALILNKVVRGKAIYTMMFLLPLAVSPLVAGYMWKLLLYPTFGLINVHLMQLMALPPADFVNSPGTALWTVLVTDVWQWTPFMVFIVLSGLEAIPNENYEIARLDGASRWQTFRTVTFPGIKAVLFVGLMIRFMDAFRSADAVYIMTYGGPGLSSETLGLHVWRLSFSLFRWGEGSVLALIVLFIIIVSSQLLFARAFPWRKTV